MIVSTARIMHPKSPPLTIMGTVLKESDDLDIMGVIFDDLDIMGVIFYSKMIFQKHLHSISRAASQRLILRKSWQVFHDRLLLGKYFQGFVLPVLEYCSAMWCTADDAHLELLDCVVSDACFSTGSVFWNIAHRRSVAVLCMLYI